jgi:hypothetical protein
MAQGLLGARHKRAFTPVFDGLCAGHDTVIAPGWLPLHRGAKIPLALIRTRNAMPAAAKKKPLKTFHATMHVTRIEEWCVEAASAEEARELLAGGAGHRCQIGDRVHVEVDAILDNA